MTRQSFYPYPVVHLVGAQVDSLKPTLAMDTSTGYLRLWTEPASSWHLKARVQVPVETVDVVLPDAERSAPPLVIALTLRSPTCRLREVLSAPFKAGESEFDVHLDSERWSGLIDAQFHVLRTSDGSGAGAYARDVHTVVAVSDALRIDVDDPPRPPGDSLEITWTDFSDSSDGWLRSHASNLFAMKTVEATGPPTIHLNQCLEGAVKVLSSTGTTGRAARTRDAVFQTIAHQVWSSILSSCLGELKDLMIDGDTTTEEAMQTVEGWMAGVVADWAPWLFTDSDKDEALTELWERVELGDWEDVLTLRMPNAIQSRFGTEKGFLGLVKELDL